MKFLDSSWNYFKRLLKMLKAHFLTKSGTKNNENGPKIGTV